MPCVCVCARADRLEKAEPEPTSSWQKPLWWAFSPLCPLQHDGWAGLAHSLTGAVCVYSACWWSKMQLIYYAASTERGVISQLNRARWCSPRALTDSRQQVPIRNSYEIHTHAARILHSRTADVTNWPRGEIWRIEISFVRPGIKF